MKPITTPSVAGLFFVAALLLIGSMSSVPEQKRSLLRQIQDSEREFMTNDLLYEKVLASNCPRYRLLKKDLLKNLLSFKSDDLDYSTTRVLISDAMKTLRSELKICLADNPHTN
jgi:hypothetical protein